jgi:hypothetical protein
MNNAPAKPKQEEMPEGRQEPKKTVDRGNGENQAKDPARRGTNLIVSRSNLFFSGTAKQGPMIVS